VLDGVRDRIDEIESLHRTRELTVCMPYSGIYHETEAASSLRISVPVIVFA
jgi:hypothetical protein